MGRAALKKERHEIMLKKLEQNPFLKDEDLARVFNVSVSTIRFDRAELGIAEYRERLKAAAKNGVHPPAAAEVLDLNLFRDGLSVLETDSSMVFAGTNIVKSQCIYSFAEDLALSVINAKAALVKVANVKYISCVRSGQRMVAKSKVARIKDKEFIVHVIIKVDMNEVFRGKFSLAVQEEK